MATPTNNKPNPLHAMLAGFALERAQMGIHTTAMATAQFYSTLVAHGMPHQAATAVTQTWLNALMLGNRSPATNNEKPFSDNDEGE